jgi:hypothetical protein
MMFNVNCALPKLNKLYIRILSSTVLSAISLIGGVIPEISWRSPSLNRPPIAAISLANQATAQQYTPEEITNYAKAGYQVELLRRQVYKEIKTIINEPPGNIACNDRETLANLNPNVREITERFCRQTIEIVQRNNLSVNRYNELKADYDRQGSFYQQVQSVLLKLQN